MRDCGNRQAKDAADMNNRQLRAIANHVRGIHGADAFLMLLEQAHRLSAAGRLQSAPVWNRIAEEISQIETSEALERCLGRAVEQAG
jgi:hypothetical protein